MPYPALIVFVVASIASQQSVWAQQKILSPEQKARLEQAQTIGISAIALTEKGPVDAAPLAHTVQARLEELGYTVMDGHEHTADAVIKIKCEERKTGGSMQLGSSLDFIGSPSRVWKGPACLVTDLIDDKQGAWAHEVRTPFEDSVAAAHAASEADTGAFALSQLQQQLQASDFALSLSAHWPQTPRLVSLLKSPESTVSIKKTILALAGSLSSPSVIPSSSLC